MCKNGGLCFSWGYVLDYFLTGYIFILVFFVMINKLDITCLVNSRGGGRLFFLFTFERSQAKCFLCFQ